jgi:hypothetical protein
LESVAASDLGTIPGGTEVLVVDDASTDRSADVARAYLQTSRLPARLVRKSLNTGLADARNTGLEVTQAPYVFMLDADNYVLPHCFSTLYEALTGSDAAAAYGLIAKFDSGTRAGAGLLSQFAWDAGTLVQSPYIDAMALLDRTKVLQVGGYSADLLAHGWIGWEDYDLWLKLAQRGERAVSVPQIVAGYRVHSGSMIHHTNLFGRSLVRHLYEKFADLLELASGANTRFGMAYKPAWESEVRKSARVGDTARALPPAGVDDLERTGGPDPTAWKRVAQPPAQRRCACAAPAEFSRPSSGTHRRSIGCVAPWATCPPPSSFGKRAVSQPAASRNPLCFCAANTPPIPSAAGRKRATWTSSNRFSSNGSTAVWTTSATPA